MKKPSMLLINKMDTEEAEQKYRDISNTLKNISGTILVFLD